MRAPSSQTAAVWADPLRLPQGRLILALEATRAVMAGPPLDKPQSRRGRVAFEHPALENVDKLNETQPGQVISKELLARLAVEVGLPAVMRWKPRMVSVKRNPLPSRHAARTRFRASAYASPANRCRS